jgi:hypothetical protein
MPPVLGHSSYMRDLSMRAEVDFLAADLLVEIEPAAPETSGV